MPIISFQHRSHLGLISPKFVNRIIYMLALLSILCMGVSLLYWSMSPIVHALFPHDGQFWCKRLTILQLPPALIASAASLNAMASLIVALRHQSFVRGLYKIRDFVGHDSVRSSLFFYGLALLLAVGYAILRFQLNYEVKTYTLEMLTRGEGNAPYQYRTLVPWVVKSLLFLAPGLIPMERLIYGIIEASSCFLLFVVFARFLTQFTNNLTSCRLFSLGLIYPLFFTHLIPNRANPIYAPYDTPAILIITIGLILLYHRRWGWYYLLFVVGTINRETTCFLTMIYFFTAFQKDSWKSIALHCGAQLLIWISIKQGIFLLYPDQHLFTGEKGTFINQVLLNKLFVTNPLSYLYFLQMMGGIWLPAILLGGIIASSFAKRALLVFIPFMFGMYLVGLLAELRIFGEMIPVTMLVFVLVVRKLAYETSLAERSTSVQNTPRVAELAVSTK